jgi:hypothetical protein
MFEPLYQACKDRVEIIFLCDTVHDGIMNDQFFFTPDVGLQEVFHHASLLDRARLCKMYYMDAPNLVIQAAGFVNVNHDLHSKELAPVLKGPVSFRDDGRMDVDLRSLSDVPVVVNLSSGVGNGTINLLIPAGEMHITLAGPVLR